MKQAPLPLFEGFIETPFEQRFQGLLRQAWKLRRWHVIVAEPGSGKTMGIRDLSATAQREAGMMGGRRFPVLAVTAPKNDPKEAALGNFLLTALGLGARGRWSERKYLLFELLMQYGVECLIFDDAHDLSMPHLIFLKELTGCGSFFCTQAGGGRIQEKRSGEKREHESQEEQTAAQRAYANRVS